MSQKGARNQLPADPGQALAIRETELPGILAAKALAEEHHALWAQRQREIDGLLEKKRELIDLVGKLANAPRARTSLANVRSTHTRLFPTLEEARKQTETATAIHEAQHANAERAAAAGHAPNIV